MSIVKYIIGWNESFKLLLSVFQERQVKVIEKVKYKIQKCSFILISAMRLRIINVIVVAQIFDLALCCIEALQSLTVKVVKDFNQDQPCFCSGIITVSKPSIRFTRFDFPVIQFYLQNDPQKEQPALESMAETCSSFVIIGDQLSDIDGFLESNGRSLTGDPSKYAVILSPSEEQDTIAEFLYKPGAFARKLTHLAVLNPIGQTNVTETCSFEVVRRSATSENDLVVVASWMGTRMEQLYPEEATNTAIRGKHLKIVTGHDNFAPTIYKTDAKNYLGEDIFDGYEVPPIFDTFNR